MSFQAPHLLFGLLAVPLAALAYNAIENRRRRRSAAWASPAMLPNVIGRKPTRLRYVPAMLFLVGLTFLLVGFARPQRSVHEHRGGLIVLVLDVSGSMNATDVKPTRLLAAKDGIKSFLHEVPNGSRIALITFTNNPLLAVQPTTDHNKILDGIPEVAKPQGTAIGDAIASALGVILRSVGVTHFGDPHPPATIVLLSDGTQTSRESRTPKQGAETARQRGIPINTVSLGTPGGVVTQQLTLANGKKETKRSAVPVDDATLKGLAQLTGGTLFKAATADELKKVYANLGSRAPNEKTKQEVSGTVTGIALFFILAGVVLSGLWFRRFA